MGENLDALLSFFLKILKAWSTHLDVSWSIMFIKRRKEGELSRLLWLWLGNLYGWVHIVEALSKNEKHVM